MVHQQIEYTTRQFRIREVVLELKHQVLYDWTLDKLPLDLGKDNIANSVQPWERYLPEYQNIKNKTKSTITPSHAQRGFADLLAQY